ncbi:MAG TPA: Crp/Fnr family transcriptional regulator [Anaerolineales bacterium]|nr:Crp/Fnr family transcriptional regulator [Anaerolineales bacterium]
MQNDILLKRLKNTELLQGLDGKALSQLAQSGVWKVFDANAAVFWEGDVETNLYYLQYGSLKAVKTSPDGREQVLKIINAGEIFHEVGVLAKRANPATAIALEESGIWLIPRQALEDVLASYPQMAIRIIENMADQIISLAALVSDLSLKNVKARFAKLLLEQAKGGVIERQSWATLTEMASRLGTVSDVLSRAIRELTKAGTIEMDKQHIRILDREGLVKQAEI